MAVEVKEQLAGFESADKGLRKTMGFTSILFMSIGSIIGSGWLLASIAAASVAGPAAIISWVIGGIFVIFVSLAYAELSGMLPRSGGIVRYPTMTHGSWTGWLIGWTYWVATLAIPAAEAEAVVTYVSSQTQSGSSNALVHVSSGVQTLQWPDGILFFLGLMVLFWLVNFFGVKLLSRINTVVTWWKLIIPTLTFIFLFVIDRGSNFTSLAGGFKPMGIAPIFEALSTTGIIFAYLGFRQALDFAGESKNPQRDVPLATILSIVITTVIYVCLQIGFIGAINWHIAGVNVGNWGGLGTSHWAQAPLWSALKAGGIGWIASYAFVLLIDSGISPSGTGWIYSGATTRIGYGMSVVGLAPKALQKHNKWGIPWIPSVIGLILGCLFVVPAPSWYKIIGLVTSLTALTYIMGGAGLPVFRKYAPNLYRPFRLPWAKFWAPVGFLAAMLIVYFSTFDTLTLLYAGVFIGLPLFAWYFGRNAGWIETGPAVVLGLVFLGAWFYLQIEGGWVMRITPPAPHAWSFGVYDAAMSADVLFFCAGLWFFGSPECRKQVQRGMWFVLLLLCIFPDSYYGAFGVTLQDPKILPSLVFPWGTLISLGIGIVAYYAAVASGWNTEEMQAIVAAAEAVEGPATGVSPADPTGSGNIGGPTAGPGTATV